MIIEVFLKSQKHCTKLNGHGIYDTVVIPTNVEERREKQLSEE